MKKFTLLIVLLGICFSINAQNVFPELLEDDLKDSLISNYKTSTVLSYDNARDTLFSRVYLENDSLTCVYSGFPIYIPPGEDPTTSAYNNYNFQTEHTWPQSKGAKTGNPKSDMHHLYPVWGSVNGSRGNNPFGELNSWNTTIWWHIDTSFNKEPINIIDECSKRGQISEITYFEPREDHKGNVARAMFYFYTMYRVEGDLVDIDFFNIQHEILYKWNYEDPPDDKEIERSYIIGNYQEGKINPFVSDISLARRAFPIFVYKTDTGTKYHRIGCQHLSQSGIKITLYDAKKSGLGSCSVCDPLFIPFSYYGLETGSKIIDVIPEGKELLNIYQNQNNEIIISINQVYPSEFTVRIFDIYGRLIDMKSFEKILAGRRKINLGQYNLIDGIYFMNYATAKRSISQKLFLR